MNGDVLWETPVGFLECMVLKIFPKYSQSYMLIWESKVEQNSAAFKK